MSRPVNSQPVLLSQSETDAFLKSVQAQLAAGAFDPTDQRQIVQMVESFGDSRGLTRLGFAEALGKVGKPATPALIDGLAEHENPVVRRACAKTMTLIADPVTFLLWCDRSSTTRTPSSRAQSWAQWPSWEKQRPLYC